MRQQRQGFSLIEVIVAIAVLGIILVAVGGLMTGNLQLRRTSNQSTEAVQLAASYLESIKRTWSVLDNYIAPATGNVVLPPTPNDPRGTNYTFVLDLRCLNIDGSNAGCAGNRDPELRQVELLVRNNQGAQVGRLVSQIGRPFDPRSTR